MIISSFGFIILKYYGHTREQKNYNEVGITNEGKYKLIEEMNMHSYDKLFKDCMSKSAHAI
jgi:hypothetical protein